jgi:hypothetical protein
MEGDVMSFSGLGNRVPEVCEHVGQTQVISWQKRKARLRLVRRGALATACLLIGICVFSVIDPVPVYTASGILSRAQNWIGGVFWPDETKDMPPPPPSDFLSSVAETPIELSDYKTIEEVYSAYGLTVYEPTQIPGSMKLSNVEADIVDSDFVSLRYRYGADGDFLVLFTIQPKGDSQQLSFPDDAFKHMAPVGKFTVFEAVSGGWYAIAVTDESIVSIQGKMEKDAFLETLDTLRVVH